LLAAFAEADGGSLFIDEIALLPAQSQLALAEMLDGAPTTRLIGGSTRDLDAELEVGRLNTDLYYRLIVMPVRIPALSERPEDIPAMFRPAHVEASLMSRDWPGNARALMSEAMRFVIGMPITTQQAKQDTDGSLGLTEHLAQVEQSLIESALRRAQGQASEAARALKLPRKTFYDKCARYSLKPEDFRA